MEHFMQVKSRPISSFVWQYLIRHWFKIRQAELRHIRLMRNIRSGLGFYDLDLLAMNLKQHDIIFKNLDGCIAWKDPQQAVMQRERLQSAQETNNESLEDVQEELGMHMQQM